MAIPSKGPVTLKTNLADYPVTLALKQGKTSSSVVSFDFCGPPVAHDGFKGMVRDDKFDAGEVQGRAITWTTLRGDHADWLNEKKVDIIVQLALRRNPDLPEVPSAVEYIKDEKDRRLYQLLFATLEAGRPFAVAKGTPPERIAALRKAFGELSQDSEFLTELQQRGGSIEYMRGEEIEQLIASIYATPRDVIDRARKVVGEH